MLRHMWRGFVAGFLTVAMSCSLTLPVGLSVAEAKNTDRAKKKKSSSRYPASSDTLVETHFDETESEAPEIMTFAINGKHFQLIENKNALDQTTRQILLGESFTRITVDRDGDGFLDSWDLQTADARMTLRSPLNGQFMFMDVEKNTPQGILLMRLYRTQDGSYALASVKTKKRSAAKSVTNDFIVGCRETEKSLQELAADVNQLIAKSSESFLPSIVENRLMDPSCAQGDFKDIKTDIVKAITKVAQSDKDWRNPSQPKPSTKGSFLQCLRYYELDTHASRISAGFAQHTDLIQHKFNWRVRCDAQVQSLGQYIHHELPKYPEIVLGPKTLHSTYMGFGTSYETKYAETFFHEMLHYSSIADENTVHNIEKCCSSDGGENSSACKNVAELVKVQKRAQLIETQVLKNVGDKYGLFRDTLRQTYGAGADQAADNFYTDVAEAYERLNDKPECKPTSESDRGMKDECDAQFKSQLSRLIDRHYGAGEGGQCRLNSERTMTPDKAEEFCSALQMASYEIYAIDSKAMDKKGFCRLNKKNQAATDFRSFLERYSALWINEAIAADDVDPIGRLCGITQDSDKFTYDFDPVNSSSKPPPVVSLERTLPDQAGGKIAGGAGEGRPVGSVGGRAASYGDVVSGPKGRTYSKDRTTRADEILADMGRQRDSTSRLSLMANAIVKPLVPEAGAKVKDLAENKRASERVSGAQSTKLKIPDPVVIQVNDGGLFVASNSSQRSSNVANATVDRSFVTLEPKDKPSSQVSATTTAQRSFVARGNGKDIGGLASLTAGGKSSGSNKQIDQTNQTISRETENEKRALKELLALLQKPFIKVRAELNKQELIESLLRHQVQVVDDEGRVHGAGFPQHKLVYDPGRRRLVLSTNSPKDGKETAGR